MAALIVYKGRFENSNERATPSKNKEYIKYMGERIHVLKDRESENGLFGYVNGQFSNKLSTEDMQKKVYDLSREGKTIFRSYISFKSETIERLGIDTKEKWENYVKYHIRTIMEAQGISIQNFEYLASVHLEKGRPHIHVVFWDKAQQVSINEQDWRINNDIRKQLIKDTFKNELDEYVRRSNEGIKNVKEISEEMMREFENSFLTSPADNMECNFTQQMLDLYNTIYDSLPTKGRLNYGFMTPELKAEIDKFSNMFLETNPQLQENMVQFLEAKDVTAKMFNSDKSPLGKKNIATIYGKAKDKVYNILGNNLLKVMKAQKQIERDKINAERESAYKQEMAMNAIVQLCRLCKNPRHAGQSNNLFKGTGDLSKAAIKELIEKNKDKGYER